MVLYKNLTTDLSKLEISSYASGIYIVEITKNTEVVRNKLIIR
jgi:hypothetical protein